MIINVSFFNVDYYLEFLMSLFDSLKCLKEPIRNHT